MKTIHNIVVIFFVAFCVSCQKQIEFDLPGVEQIMVVEGKIESGQPPIVFLTTTQGYFDPIDSSTFDNIFIHNADVSVSDGTTNYPLTEINFGLASVYTTFNTAAFGVNGKDYVLTVNYDNKVLTAQTQVPYPVPLDSVWFERADLTNPLDSLGFLYFEFEDPDTSGNCYRWFSKRINTYKYNYDFPYDNIAGQQKDTTYIAPFGGSTDDKFFNGLSFEFAVARGELASSQKPDDEGIEARYFKLGDTVAIRATAITYPTYLWVRSMEDQAISTGSPFASPGNLPSNINGDGVGIWAGYGIYYDTVICQ